MVDSSSSLSCDGLDARIEGSGGKAADEVRAAGTTGPVGGLAMAPGEAGRPAAGIGGAGRATGAGRGGGAKGVDVTGDEPGPGGTGGGGASTGDIGDMGDMGDMGEGGAGGGGGAPSGGP